MGSATVHRYEVDCAWEGSTGVGYDAYDRGHRASVHPALDALAMSADPAFRGDASRVNPEQLLLLAASSCQLLSFLAVAARARVDVVSYTDRAEAVMPEDDQPVRITTITLRPQIRVRGDVDEDRLRHLCKVAHRECFIANSLTSEVRIEPVFSVGDEDAGPNEIRPKKKNPNTKNPNKRNPNKRNPNKRNPNKRNPNKRN